MLRELAQQQSALSQQQTALLQLQAESLRLQRLLIERAIGGASHEGVPTLLPTVSAEHLAPEPVVEAPLAEVSFAPQQDGEVSVAASVRGDKSSGPDSPFGEPRKGDMPTGSKPSSSAASLPTFAVHSRGARYMQAPAPAPIHPVTRQDVNRLTRLYESGDAAHLVLNFGQYRGAPLVQVAQMDPDYVHQLALTAQRPEVRAAARQMVIALEEVAAHSRPARRSTRRARSTG